MFTIAVASDDGKAQKRTSNLGTFHNVATDLATAVQTLSQQEQVPDLPAAKIITNSITPLINSLQQTILAQTRVIKCAIDDLTENWRVYQQESR